MQKTGDDHCKRSKRNKFVANNKISVLIIAQNNASTIERTLKSVQGFDEIVVIDGGSTDCTKELALKYGAKIVEHPFKSFPEQRSFSLTQAEHEWCLVVDSDEEITEELQEELYRLINSPNPALLYRIMRTEYLLGDENQYGYGRSDYQERFFQKSHVRYEGELHEYPVIDGTKPNRTDPRTINLPAHFRMHHNPENNVSMIVQRFPKYTLLKAQEKIKQGRTVSLLELIFCFPLSFLQIISRRWRAGRIGVVEALSESANRLFIKMLIYEHGILERKKKGND